MSKCKTCEGKGHVYIPAGEGDVDIEECQDCMGYGYNPPIGFFPNNWRASMNVWCDMPRCPKCGLGFTCMEQYLSTHCPACHMSFVD